jgi:hypothetical protein
MYTLASQSTVTRMKPRHAPLLLQLISLDHPLQPPAASTPQYVRADVSFDLQRTVLRPVAQPLPCFSTLRTL